MSLAGTPWTKELGPLQQEKADVHREVERLFLTRRRPSIRQMGMDRQARPDLLHKGVDR
jgi:hypothetical protein